MMRKFLFLLLFIFACSRVDPVETALKHSTVQSFLERHPDATIDTKQLTEQQAELFIEEIKTTCGDHMEPKAYKRITINESDAKMILYVSNSIDCLYQTDEEIQELEKPKAPEVKPGEVEPKSPDVKNVKITADSLDLKNERIFPIIITESNIHESFELSFRPECQVWRVKLLEIYLDNELVYKETPTCDSVEKVPISGVTQGTYGLKFRTVLGDYTITDLEYAGINVESFSISTKQESIVLADFKSMNLGETKTFNLDKEVENVFLTFESSIEGILKIVLNNKVVYERETFKPPQIKLSSDFFTAENTLLFTKGSYNPICQDVALEIYEHDNQPVLCNIPEDSKIQMIFKNIGKKTIHEVNIFVKGDSTLIDTFDLDLEPQQIFTRVIEYDDIGKIREVTITPTTDEIQCKSLSFTDLRDC